MLKDGLCSVIFDDEITVYWNRVSELCENDAYCVFVGGNLVSKTSKTFYEIKSLVPKTQYSIRVILQRGTEEILVGEEVFTTKEVPHTIDVTKPPYNAVGDGVTMNTEALQRALDDCKSGQRVYFPEGIYLTGALNVHSNTELYLDDGATIMGTANPDDYLPFIKSRSEGLSMDCYRSLINMGELCENSGVNCENIIIRGGTICGGGTQLCENIESAGLEILKDYIASIGDEMCDFECGAKTIAGRLRGRLVNISNCKNVIFSNTHFMGSPYWCIHFIYSENVITKSCKITTYGTHNGDGWDPDSSVDCVCFNTEFDCGDNCIAIKSGKNPDGNIINRPTKNIVVFDCRIIRGGGFAVGSEMSGGVQDVTMWNNDMSGSSIGINLKTTRKRGGYIKDFRIYDSILPNFAIRTALNYNNDGEGAKEPPYVENILCENCVLTGVGYRIFSSFFGEDEKKVEKVYFPSVRILGFDDKPENIDNVIFRNCIIRPTTQGEGQSIVVNNCKGISFENLKVQ